MLNSPSKFYFFLFVSIWITVKEISANLPVKVFFFNETKKLYQNLHFLKKNVTKFGVCSTHCVLLWLN